MAARKSCSWKLCSWKLYARNIFRYHKIVMPVLWFTLCILLFAGCRTGNGQGAGMGNGSGVTDDTNYGKGAGNGAFAEAVGIAPDVEETGYIAKFHALPTEAWVELPCMTEQGLYYVADLVDEENYVHQELQSLLYGALSGSTEGGMQGSLSNDIQGSSGSGIQGNAGSDMHDGEHDNMRNNGVATGSSDTEQGETNVYGRGTASLILQGTDRAVDADILAMFPGADATVYIIWKQNNPARDMFLAQYDAEGAQLSVADINKAMQTIDGYRVQAAAGDAYIYLWQQGKAVAIPKSAGQESRKVAFTFETGYTYSLVGNGTSAWGLEVSGRQTIVSRLGGQAQAEESFVLDGIVVSAGLTKEGNLLWSDGQHLNLLKLDTRNAESAQSKDGQMEDTQAGSAPLQGEQADESTASHTALQARRLLTWTDYGISPSTVEAIYGTDQMLAVFTQDMNEKFLVILQETADGKALETTEIVLATANGYDTKLNALITAFVRDNPGYRVEIMNIYDGEDWLDQEERMKRLNQRILDGNAPDLIDLNYVDWRNYLESGVLEDLNLWLEKSEILDRDMFYEQPLQNYESVGKLGAIPYFFYLSLYRGKAEIFDAIPQWTVAEAKKLSAEYPEATLLSVGAPREGILFFTGGGLEAFLDREHHTSHFNTPEFLEILEAANCLKPLDALKQAEGDVTDILNSEQRQDRLLLQWTSINNILDVQYLKKMGKYDMKLVGCPTQDGKGAAHMACTECFGICSAGRQKEAAWKFLEYCLTHQHQNQDDLYFRNGFYTRKSAMEQALQEAMTPEYKTDSEGNIRLDPDGNPMELPKLRMNNTALYAASQADVDELMYWMEHSVPTVYGEEMGQEYTIMWEETQSFFAGQKSAKEVAEIMDRRVRLYLAE